MSRREARAARRAAISGAGPTDATRVGRFPGAAGGFALFGEVLMTGLLVTLVALPVVTLPVALAAGIRHLRRYLNAEDSRLVFFWKDARAAALGGLVVGAIAAVAAVFLVLDLALAASGALPGGPFIAVVGWVGLAAVALGMLSAAAAWTPALGWRGAVRGVPGAIAGDPAGSLYLLSAVGFTGVVTWALPPLIIAGLGCAVLAAVAVPARPARRR